VGGEARPITLVLGVCHTLRVVSSFAVRKTTIYLPESIHRRMDRAAKRLRLSRAEITRAALEDYLDRSEQARGLPPSVGMGDNPTDRAADYEQRLARGWGRS